MAIRTLGEAMDMALNSRRAPRGDAPVALDRTPVPVRGETLSAVWWRGRQWAVTEHGIEALDGTYAIGAETLTLDLSAHSWPQHMAEKRWVDNEEFATAWLVALALHGGVRNMEQRLEVRDALRRVRLPAPPAGAAP